MWIGILTLVLILLGTAIYIFIWPVSGLNLEVSWRCNLRKGKMVDTSCGIAGCFYRCSVIYPDANQVCQTSDDCLGKCISFDEGNIFNLRSLMAKKDSSASIDGCSFDWEKKEFECLEPMSGQCYPTKIIKNCEYGLEIIADRRLKSVGQCSM